LRHREREEMSKEDLTKLQTQAYEEVLEFFSHDRIEVEKWCQTRVRGLGYITPEQAMQTEEGIARLRTLIGRLRHGIPT